MDMETTDGLISAMVLDGEGGAQAIDAAGVAGWSADDGTLWLHLERKHPQTIAWLNESSGLREMLIDSLLAEDARPRGTSHPGGLVVVLRGVNLNPGAEPDDMISLRLWVDKHRIISLRSPKLMAVQDLRDTLVEGLGPRDSGGVLSALAGFLTERIAPVVAGLDEKIDDMEEALLDDDSVSPRLDLAAARRQAIELSRYLAPQRDAMERLATLSSGPLSAGDRSCLHEWANRTTRYVEDLGALRERSALIQEEVLARHADRMNQNMYVLSLVAAIFLPLGLVTGLLGINVGGMPGLHSSVAFLWVCVLLVILGFLEYLLLRWFKLL